MSTRTSTNTLPPRQRFYHCPIYKPTRLGGNGPIYACLAADGVKMGTRIRCPRNDSKHSTLSSRGVALPNLRSAVDTGNTPLERGRLAIRSRGRIEEPFERRHAQIRTRAGAIGVRGVQIWEYPGVHHLDAHKESCTTLAPLMYALRRKTAILGFGLGSINRLGDTSTARRPGRPAKL